MKFLKIIPKNYFSQFILVILFLLFSSVIEIIGIGFIPIFVGFLVDPGSYIEKINIDIINFFFFRFRW